MTSIWFCDFTLHLHCISWPADGGHAYGQPLRQLNISVQSTTHGCFHPKADAWVILRPGVGWPCAGWKGQWQIVGRAPGLPPNCDVDIDECVRATAGCSPYAGCLNNKGGFTCTCYYGFTGTFKLPLPHFSLFMLLHRA
jgi:hypothetical protein